MQRLFDFMLTVEVPPRVIGDKAYDSDKLDAELAEQGIEMIAPRESENRELHAGRSAIAALRSALESRADDLVDSELQAAVHSLGEIDDHVPGIPSPRMHDATAQAGSGIGSKQASKRGENKHSALAGNSIHDAAHLEPDLHSEK